jgi:plasmid stabilization system protein ParE
MKVRYTRRARADLEEIFVYLDAKTPAAALSVKRTIERRVAQLAIFPLMAPETDVRGIHELTIIRYPYKVYYEISAWRGVDPAHPRRTAASVEHLQPGKLRALTKGGRCMVAPARCFPVTWPPCKALCRISAIP